jgi:hypothetical protein
MVNCSILLILLNDSLYNVLLCFLALLELKKDKSLSINQIEGYYSQELLLGFNPSMMFVLILGCSYSFSGIIASVRCLVKC